MGHVHRQRSLPYHFLPHVPPVFSGQFHLEYFLINPDISQEEKLKKKSKNSGYLGNIYNDGEYIVRQGEPGNCMYEIQDGKVVVFRSEGADEILLAELSKGEFFGEMAIFEHGVRSASVRAVGEIRVLTIDKKILLSRITQDPTLAFRILEKMSHRIREPATELARLKSSAYPDNACPL